MVTTIVGQACQLPLRGRRRLAEARVSLPAVGVLLEPSPRVRRLYRKPIPFPNESAHSNGVGGASSRTTMRPEAKMSKMLILRGNSAPAGSYPDEQGKKIAWPIGALHVWAASQYAKRKGYDPVVLDKPGQP